MTTNNNYSLNLFLKYYNQEDLNNVDIVRKWIYSFDNPKLRWTHINNILYFVKDVNQFEELKKEIVSPEIKEATWDYLLEKRDSLDKNSVEYIMLCLFTMLPPIKNTEMFYICVGGDTNNKLNWYVRKKKQIVINTKSKRIFNLSEELYSILETYIINNNILEGNKIIDVVEPGLISKKIGKIFGYSMGCSQIRRLFCHTFSLSVEEKRIVEYFMCMKLSNTFNGTKDINNYMNLTAIGGL